MSTLFSHTTALHVWRVVGSCPNQEAALRHFAQLPQSALPLDAALENEFRNSVAAREEINVLRSKGMGFLDPPVHRLCFDSSERKRSSFYVDHVVSESLPSGSVVRLPNDVNVVSPELCFVQMATELAFPQLIALGFELCGSYRIVSGSEKGFISRDPLTQLDKLKSYAASATAVRGSAIALRALSYVAEGSESPMETALALLLCLPLKLGGYGLPQPEMNHRVNSGAFARRNQAKDHYRCDLFWPESNVAVEYNSKAYHFSEIDRSNDACRHNTLVGEGVHSMIITPAQVFDYAKFEQEAHTLAKLLGHRMRKSRVDWTAKRLELRDAILPAR